MDAFLDGFQRTVSQVPDSVVILMFLSIVFWIAVRLEQDRQDR